ncbi:MAG: hypothetical protein KDB14_05140 [Planctomycetales bacterium]|nr:hypothetical protein [Planctomycetales bacterium]
MATELDRWVEFSFDCLPLRSVNRVDVPLDASPKYRQLCERVKAAIEHHGAHNTYFLYNARCKYHLVNDDRRGTLEFEFHGTVFTDSADLKTERCDLEVTLLGETCDWLTQPVVDWFSETVRQGVITEFDRYISAGDLQQTRDRIEKIQQASDEADGFVGMYL